MFSYKQVVLLINPLGLNVDLHITGPIKKYIYPSTVRKKSGRKRDRV